MKFHLIWKRKITIRSNFLLRAVSGFGFGFGFGYGYESHRVYFFIKVNNNNLQKIGWMQPIEIHVIGIK